MGLAQGSMGEQMLCLLRCRGSKLDLLPVPDDHVGHCLMLLAWMLHFPSVNDGQLDRCACKLVNNLGYDLLGEVLVDLFH
eukprot:15339580-Ditylum_brightwellii.AAC.1